MNIMVFDVPADKTGALSILNDFHSETLKNSNKDINWFFVVGLPKLEERENIKVLRYPWIKRSWFHRLYFDHFIANRLIKQYKIDKLLSFQNLVIPHTNIPQTLYVHQSLPFVKYKFKFNENKLFWIYQNIIGEMIKRSIIEAEKIIVQSKWMMEACRDQAGIDSKKIRVISPKINVDIQKSFTPSKVNLKTFFFPAVADIYKNHKIIIEASKALKEKGIEDYKIILTINGDENNHSINLYNEVVNKSLPIDFIGILSLDEVFELYTKSILIFPSYIEAFGLPILESRLHKGIVFACNCPFSNEILEGYSNSYFFDPFDANELSSLMEDVLVGKIKYRKTVEEVIANKDNGWVELINELM